MNENQLTVSTIIKGLIVYILASVVVVILGMVDTFSSAGSFISSVASGDMDAMFGGGIGVVDILLILANAAVIYGIYIYWQSLKRFAPALDSVGANSVKNLATAALLIMIAGLLEIFGVFIPFMGSVVGAICLIVAFIFNLMGYSSMQGSTSLSELGKAGAKQLFLGFIFAIIAIVLGWIPFIGWLFALVFNILYWIFLFKGWGKIKSSMGN